MAVKHSLYVLDDTLGHATARRLAWCLSSVIPGPCQAYAPPSFTCSDATFLLRHQTFGVHCGP